MKIFIRSPTFPKGEELAVYIGHRVRQQDCENDTTPLNRRNNLCLRSPKKLKIVLGPQKEKRDV